MQCQDAKRILKLLLAGTPVAVSEACVQNVSIALADLSFSQVGEPQKTL
jgi:hypothetical protein